MKRTISVVVALLLTSAVLVAHPAPALAKRTRVTTGLLHALRDGSVTVDQLVAATADRCQCAPPRAEVLSRYRGTDGQRRVERRRTGRAADVHGLPHHRGRASRRCASRHRLRPAQHAGGRNRQRTSGLHGQSGHQQAVHPVCLPAARMCRRELYGVPRTRALAQQCRPNPRRVGAVHVQRRHLARRGTRHPSARDQQCRDVDVQVRRLSAAPRSHQRHRWPIPDADGDAATDRR